LQIDDDLDPIKTAELPNDNRILFGSKMDADIFQKSLEHHSSSLSLSNTDSSMTADVNDDTTTKPRKKRSGSSDSVVVSLRRTSTSSEPLAFEIVETKLPAKKRKTSVVTASASPEAAPPSNFYFILPDDFELLTDYFVTLYSQVTRGVMTEADMNTGNRKNAASMENGVGFLGFRCRHCGGKEKGSYFPSSSKNLQACPPTLHAHLLKCPCCPETVKRSLKQCKTKHKQDILSKTPGSLTEFYKKFWQRIQNLDPSFDGEAHTQAILDRLGHIEKLCTPPTNDRAVDDTAATNDTAVDDNRNDLIPTIVSYEELENDTIISQALSIAVSEPTESDWELALELLRRPPTPNSQINLENPSGVISITPNRVQNVYVPIAARISDSGEGMENEASVEYMNIFSSYSRLTIILQSTAMASSLYQNATVCWKPSQ
jgi:hypothetical protein